MYLSTISGHEVQMEHVKVAFIQSILIEHLKIYGHTNLGDSARLSVWIFCVCK